MYVYNGQLFNESLPQVVNDTQYPAYWFDDSDARQEYEIATLEAVAPIFNSLTQTCTEQPPQLVGNVWKQQWLIEDLPPDVAAQNIVSAKELKNTQINQWRLQANQSTFPFMGKQIGCDILSRSDIDGVAGSIALFGTFPNNFPMAWKCADNSYISLPDVDAFKAMYAAMTDTGTLTWNRSQELKVALQSASTQEVIDAITWEV